MAMQVFSTDAAPIAERAYLFRTQMLERFSIGLDVEGAEGEPLSTQVSAYCGRCLRFASLQFSPHRTSSSALRLVGQSRLLVTLQDEGIAYISQDRRHSHLAPGEFCLIDPQMPFSIETTQIRTRSIYLDRASLVATMPQVDGLTARTISGKTGPGRIFRSMLDEMFQMASTLDEDTADSIADALPYVLVTALNTLNKQLVPVASRMKLFHQQRILQFARRRLRDPRLDAKTISHGVNLSPRYVYDIFSDERISLMKWVWFERLEHCRRDLEDPALTARSIGEIAYAWGFSDVAHFSRSYRQRFAVSPREWRKNARQKALSSYI